MSDSEHIGWAILELMGHRRVAGYVSERDVAGQPMLQIDIPKSDGVPATQIYSGTAVYAITPTTEEIATAVALNNQPTPVHRWELPQPKDEQGADDAIRDVDVVNELDEDGHLSDPELYDRR